jgi:hypothetical protein
VLPAPLKLLFTQALADAETVGIIHPLTQKISKNLAKAQDQDRRRWRALCCRAAEVDITSSYRELS